VKLWGTDLALQLLATHRLTLTGSASYMSKDCFEFSGDEDCSSGTDIALNAPRWKGSAGARWSDDVQGISLDGRVRFAAGFPMNSGVYVGDVESHSSIDANASYRIPGLTGATASVTVTNVLNSKHQQFIGAPEIGRLTLVGLSYSF
jgi:iron complex outermembrane receptor protein